MIYTAVLDVRRETAETLARLLSAHRERLGTRKNTRALGVFKQAVLVLRWLVDGTRPARLPSSRGESHPSALTERSVTISRHSALAALII
ncbi:hypothetical protein ABT124_48015, partial [Streptomyces sp. NPDC001982]